MNLYRLWMGGAVIAVLFQCGATQSCAQTSQDPKIASALMQRFETVAATDSRFLLNFKGDMDHDESLNAMRLPFIEFMAALTPMLPSTESDIERSYGFLMAGAKDFSNPGGAGLVNSHKCYIAALEAGSQPNLESDFSRAASEMIDGRQVWTWSVPPGEGMPSATYFYAAQVGKRYLVLSNSRQDFIEISRQLTIEVARPLHLQGMANWEIFSAHQYWAYRGIRREAVADAESAGINHIGADVRTIFFYADITKREATVKVTSSDRSMKSPPNVMPPSELYRFHVQEPGVWGAEFPLSRDHAGIERMSLLFTALGSGIYL